ncbi:UNVERIFIED_CONTAM: hypothetical protein FKN15_014750 [Acipenser sinensis]
MDPKGEEPVHLQPKREEPVCPQPKREEPECPQPKREEPVCTQPKRGKAERLQPTSLPAEEENLLFPPPPAEGECLLVLPGVAAGYEEGGGRSRHHQAQEVAWSPAPLPLVALVSWARTSAWGCSRQVACLRSRCPIHCACVPCRQVSFPPSGHQTMD